MSARITKAEVAFLLPPPRSQAAEQVEAMRQAASRAAQAATLDAVGGFFARLLGDVMAWPERSRARAELAAMDDHALADLGLYRGDIDAAVTGRRR